MSGSKVEVLLAKRLFKGRLWQTGDRASSWWGVGQIVREMNDRGWSVSITVTGLGCEVLCSSRRGGGQVSREGRASEAPKVVAECSLAALGERA